MDEWREDIAWRSQERCEYCERVDVDEHWLWTELERLADEDCEFDSVNLSFCSQEHAGAFLQERPIDWQRASEADMAHGVRVDRFFLGCGLLAIILSVIGVVALLQWIF